MNHVRTVRSPRVPELDGLRGIAILLVLCHHFVWVPRPASLPDHVANAIAALSWTGTDLLLVLSGFLVTKTMLEVRDSPAPLARFYARTFFRLAPAYAAFLVAYFHILLPLLGDRLGFKASAASEQIWFWIPLANWRSLEGTLPFVTSHLWAVALLLQLVFVWPLIVRWAGEHRLAYVCASLIATSFFLRLIYSGALTPELVAKLTPMRMDAMAFGALAALCHRRADWFERAQGWLGPVTSAGLLALGAVALANGGRLSPSDPATAVAGLSIIAMLAACAVFRAASHSGIPGMTSPLLETPWLGELGRHSYAIYLVHYPISIFAAAYWSDLIRSLETRITWGVALLCLLVGTICSYLAALVVWNALERPFLRLKASFPYWPEAEEADRPRQEPEVEVEPVSTSSW